MLRRADHDLAAEAMRALVEIKNVSPRGVVSSQVLTRLMGLPPLLRTSGVLPVLAFYTAKGGDGDAVKQAYDIVGSRLRAQIAEILGWTEQGSPSLDLAFLERLNDQLRGDPGRGVRVSVRLEEFSGWLRRLAEALKKEQERTRAKETAEDQVDELDGRVNA